MVFKQSTYTHTHTHTHTHTVFTFYGNLGTESVQNGNQETESLQNGNLGTESVQYGNLGTEEGLLMESAIEVVTVFSGSDDTQRLNPNTARPSCYLTVQMLPVLKLFIVVS